MRYTEKLIQTNDRETGRENDRAETELNHSKLGIPGCLYVSHEAKNKLKKGSDNLPQPWHPCIPSLHPHNIRSLDTTCKKTIHTEMKLQLKS